MEQKDTEVVHSLLEDLENRTSTQPDAMKIMYPLFSIFLHAK